MATATEYAWAAGFFDGEGCVSLFYRHGPARPKRRLYAALSIIIAQKDRRSLDRFQEVFGREETIGIVYRTIHKRPYYRLTLSGERAGFALTAMLPYLTVKREVGLLGLALQQSIREFSPKARSAGLPDDVLEYRRSLVVQAKWLNSGRWAAAETKSSGSSETTGSDSPACSNEKAAESDRNDRSLRRVI